MNESTAFKKYGSIKPLNHKIDYAIDKCNRGCHNKYFLTFDHICVYDITLINIKIKEINILTISD